jgi:hypothetical protein
MLKHFPRFNGKNSGKSLRLFVCRSKGATKRAGWMINHTTDDNQPQFGRQRLQIQRVEFACLSDGFEFNVPVPCFATLKSPARFAKLAARPLRSGSGRFGLGHDLPTQLFYPLLSVCELLRSQLLSQKIAALGGI